MVARWEAEGSYLQTQEQSNEDVLGMVKDFETPNPTAMTYFFQQDHTS